MKSKTGLKASSWLLILLLLVLHQDYWNWTSDALWFGFLPVQLGYHIIISILTAGFWWWLVNHDWPQGTDQPPKSEGSA